MWHTLIAEAHAEAIQCREVDICLGVARAYQRIRALRQRASPTALWTEVYCPRRADDMLGNLDSVRALAGWLGSRQGDTTGTMGE